MTATFKDYSLSDTLLKTLALLNYKAPTKVQEQVLPVLLAEQDAIVQSRTGSGKTAAFAIPICEKVIWDELRPQALVLTPTRELALQVKEDFFHIGRLKRIKVVGLYGKAPFHVQQKELKQKTHVVVATPGRLLDHMARGTIDLSHMRYLIIDEADEMLKMGFMEDVENIILALPKKRTTMLFSATMPPSIKQLCENYMQSPKWLEGVVSGPSQVHQVAYKVAEEEKLQVLKDVLTVESPEACMIFCNRKEKVNELAEALQRAGIPCEKLHGDLEQKERFAIMSAYRKGRYRFLIATDVAARGLDIAHVTHVINYDLPEDQENYVHRIGRTGRAGQVGKAFSFVTPLEEKQLDKIITYMGQTIPYAKLPHPDTVAALQEDFNKHLQTAMAPIVEKGAQVNQGIMKLHINAGKKTKMRPVDIVGTLCNLPKMTAEDIGIIQIQDISTFVEILNGKGEAVYQALQNKPIKGRMRRVSKVED